MLFFFISPDGKADDAKQFGLLETAEIRVAFQPCQKVFKRLGGFLGKCHAKSRGILFQSLQSNGSVGLGIGLGEDPDGGHFFCVMVRLSLRSVNQGVSILEYQPSGNKRKLERP